MRPTGLLICLVFTACSNEPEANRKSATAPSAENPAQGPAANSPATIDCARASGQAEQAVCADKGLAALDRLAGPEDEQLRNARSDCGRADELRQCLVETYAVRIAERAKASSADRATVTGPAKFRCGRDDFEATFINSEPGYVVLGGGDGPVVLERTTAASGVRYEGRVDGGAWSFWNKGREAILNRGGEEAKCAEQPAAG